MPVVRTSPPENRPGHFGEYELYQRLCALTIPRTELWFNLRFPGVPEIDLIINEPTLGTYLAEVKSFTIDEISDYTREKIILTSGELRSNPMKQIERADFGLRSLLTRKNNDEKVLIPYLQKTAIWSRITREDFIDKFRRQLIYEEVQGMIFADDLKDEDTFLASLAHVTENHYFSHVPRAVRQEQPGVQILRDITSDFGAKNGHAVALQEGLSKRELAELRTSTKKTSSRLEKYFSGESYQVAFRGFPGSGKTLSLREIGIEHALAGKSVLFMCFNKVLATKVRLEVAEIMSSRSTDKYLFLVHDQYEFYKTIVPTARLGNIESEVIPEIARLKAQGELLTFDTILIDEAQDANSELFHVANLISHDKTSMFVAYGDNQHLYNRKRFGGTHSPELTSFLEKATTEQFNRNFRSGPATQLICAAISDYYPEVDDALDWLKAQINARNNRNRQDAFEFDEFIYEPKIQILDTPEGHSHARLMLETVFQLVLAARQNGDEFDDLILVHGKKSTNYIKVLELLDLLEVPYLDLVQDGNRRKNAKANELVITTYHGARGLTCKNALVLDICEQEEKSGRSDMAPLNNLLNIALSRATENTVIVSGKHENEYSGQEALQYITALLELLTDLKP